MDKMILKKDELTMDKIYYHKCLLITLFPFKSNAVSKLG